MSTTAATIMKSGTERPMCGENYLWMAAPCRLNLCRKPLRRCRTTQDGRRQAPEAEANSPCCMQCLNATEIIENFDLGYLALSLQAHTPDV
jgi:hypothetical protein